MFPINKYSHLPQASESLQLIQIGSILQLLIEPNDFYVFIKSPHASHLPSATLGPWRTHIDNFLSYLFENNLINVCVPEQVLVLLSLFYGMCALATSSTNGGNDG
jgi:hypothetical protein